MIINMTGGGGGGLNFKVVGGTAVPSNPKENTIWVNTSTAITDYVFSSTQPSSTNGRVWISIGTSSQMEFNALKKDGLQVYPISAQQYISGAWVGVNAMSYQNGEWVNWWNGELFVNGYTNDAVTGGLKAYPYKSSTSGSTEATFTITNDNGIMKTSIVSSLKAGAIFTENAIDITNFNALEINVTQRTGQTGSVYFGATKTKENSYIWVVSGAIDKTGKTTLDLSGLSGKYYCLICLAGNGDKQVSFDEWKLVR